MTRPVALGARLRRNREILTLGLKPNFSDYSPGEKDLIRKAEKIYFPTAFYADLFNAMGKPTFPSFHTYKFAQDKIRQTAMFNLLDIPHPRTRVFYGRRQKKTIQDYFSFPFIAKKGRGSARGEHVFLIRTAGDLNAYLSFDGPAYIQEYLPIKKDMRIVIIGDKIRLAYWRKAPDHDFKTNLSQGGQVILDPVPDKACSLALEWARACGWDDIGLDIAKHQGRFLIIEANVKYGTRGFQKAGIDYHQMLADLVIRKKI